MSFVSNLLFFPFERTGAREVFVHAHAHSPIYTPPFLLNFGNFVASCLVLAPHPFLAILELHSLVCWTRVLPDQT